MLKWLKNLVSSKKEVEPQDYIEVEPEEGKFMTKMEVSAIYDARKNKFVQYNSLHVEGNPERLGMLLLRIAENEPSIKRIIDIAAGVKPAKDETGVFEGMPNGKGGLKKDRGPSEEMSDEQIKEMIRKNNEDMFGHGMSGSDEMT